MAALEAALFDDAEVLLRRAIEIRRALGDRSGLAGSLVAMHRMLVGAYRSEEAVALLEPAMEELEGTDDELALVRLATAMSGAYALHQDTDKALQLIDRTMASAERLDATELVVELLMRRGIILGQIGRSYEAVALTKGALDLAEAHGLVGLAMACRGNLGFYLNERDPARALGLDRETMAETRRLGMRRRMLLMLGNTSEEARVTGDWDRALSELGAELAGELDGPARGWFLGNSLVLRSWRGEVGNEESTEWEAIIEGHDDPQAAADYRDIQAVRALAEGHLAAARRHALDSFFTAPGRPSRRAVAARAALWSGERADAAADLEAIDQTGVHGPVADLRRTTVEAGIAALDGQTSEAVALFRVAREGFREAGLPWEEALVGIDMATLLDVREPEVVAAAERSREILTGLRAAPFLERLEAAMAVDVPAPVPGSKVPTERPAKTGDRTAV